MITLDCYHYSHCLCIPFHPQIGQLQGKVRDSSMSQQDHHDVLKSELARRDETIQKLRRDVLVLQEKRDTYQTEVGEGEIHVLARGRI